MSKIKRIVARAHQIGLPLPQRWSERARGYSNFVFNEAELDRLFAGRKLAKDPCGYWSVDPMIPSIELAQYYSSAYWRSRGDRNHLLNFRDLAHFQDLREHLGRRLIQSSEKIAVNFGSGHGGASFLFYAQGFKVVNVDAVESVFSQIEHRKSLEEIQEQIDLFYSSHSLEHVTDVGEVVTQIDRLLKPGGLVFIEVPNAAYSAYSTDNGRGQRSPRIQPPHTYYFSIDFFRQLKFEVVSLGTFRYEGDPFGCRVDSGSGEVIRFIGRKPL